ncbi:hypothetical protein BD413DRAFT_717411, partial [Trametes elegans]
MSGQDKETLKDTLAVLSDSSAGELQRVKAARTIRTTFSTWEAIARFDQGGGKSWLAVFQALFTAYHHQLQVCIKKLGRLPTPSSSGVYVTRLSEIADIIRALVVAARERFNTKVLKSVLTFLIGAISHKGRQLVPLVARDFTHVILSIISWKPHLQALSDDRWHTLIAIAFNAVLGQVPERILHDLDADVDDPDESAIASGNADSLSTASAHSPSLKRVRSPALPKATNRSPSAEQSNFMTIISILLRSPTAPILSSPSVSEESDDERDPHEFPRRLLSYFSRFLRYYPPDTSLRHDYLSALSAALSHFTLNCRAPVANFATCSWKDLLAMWGAKDSEKSDLVIISRMLFHVLTAEPIDHENSGIPIEALVRLSSITDVFALNRALAFGPDTFRLRLSDSSIRPLEGTAFTSSTFEHGWGLTDDRALTWATLELYADCAETLYVHAESTYSTVAQGRKKRKTENPIPELLQSLKLQATQKDKIHELQSLLFFAKNHWLVLHEDARQDAVISLTSILSFADADVQSWAFLCLAEIASAECLAPHPPTDTHSASRLASLWDPVWTHAMRRANVPAVSRAACHTAHALLLRSKHLLSSQRVLAEIESFVKDLDVQGPAYPYDSVCAFMISCLRFANQDARLYRMHMEEKVLSWLVEAWRVVGQRRKAMPMHTVADIHSLLEAITGSSKRVQLPCRVMLPSSALVDAMVEETQTRVIRDFQLHARLPPFNTSQTSSRPSASSLVMADGNAMEELRGSPTDSADFAPPRGRERRVSSFLLRIIEQTCEMLRTDVPKLGHTTETLRCSLDIAVVALLFEASRLTVSIQSNRKVIQAACKLVGLVSPQLADDKRPAPELRLLLGALDPVILADTDDPDNVGWEALVPPGERSGIKTQVLHRLLAEARAKRVDSSLLVELQKCVFRSSNVQGAFAELLKRLREVVRLVMKRVPNTNPFATGDDGFGPVQAVVATAESFQREASISTYNGHIARACVSALVIVPILQSSSGEPARDVELWDLVLGCDFAQFLVLAPPCLEQVQRKRLHLSRPQLKDLLGQLKELMMTYEYSHQEEAQLFLVKMLVSTLHLWCNSTAADTDVSAEARFYCSQCIRRLQVAHRPSWRLRDAIIRFLDDYLVHDPKQEIWALPDADNHVPEPQDMPAAVLPTLGDDDDIRIRFRLAVINTRLFTVCRLASHDSTQIYHEIRRHLSTSQSHYESILTRLLCLGNIVISDSSVRRGAYWHLLEIAFYSNAYHQHLKAVLLGVAARLGMERLSDLFDCYASQFAYSIRLSNNDISRFPPDLLGYRDRRHCAEATFRAFTPTNLLSAGTDENVAYGVELFARHCQTIQKSERDGIEECFADLVAQHITNWMDGNADPDMSDAALDNELKEKTRLVKHEGHFQKLFRQHVDDIVVAFLRTLGDQDISANGPIVSALRDSGRDDAAETFIAVTRYRALDTFDAHKPNLPVYGTHTILRAIDWYRGRVVDADSSAVTYHVLHQLFANIERSPLVNEQCRLLNALCLWVSCHHRHFEDQSLLRVLIRRAVALLAQSDLARSAQSLLEWSLSLCLAHPREADHRLADVLIRISAIAYGFSESRFPYLAQLGAQLMSWVEERVASLYQKKPMRQQVKRALAAWPRELPVALRSACDDLQLADLKSALNDPGISSSKFRLVRKIYELALHSADDGKRPFGNSDFWRLKACIPSETHLFDSDIDAFTSLLVLHRGGIDGVNSDQYARDTIRYRHRHIVESKVSHAKEIAPYAEVEHARSATILSLLAMVETAPAPQVYTAYQTLCALMSTSSADFIDASLSSDMRQELECLRALPKPRNEVSAPDLESILASDELHNLASDYPGWITRVTTLLSEALGSRDPFFSPLKLVLQSDYAFAEEMLPILVHSLLQIEYAESRSTAPSSLRSLLSRYFSSVLIHDEAETACYRAITSAVLHLRSFQPEQKPRDALAHDKWLSIDFTLLSRCAIKCGAYTTALLFLELARDHRDAAPGEGGSTEDILFEIYSHIDEPDGFYGIQTDDLRNLFVKRLRHENQWEKAFSYHGAVYESGAAGSIDTDGIVQSLYSFGFNHLALDTLQTFSDTNGSLGSSALAHSLGWRAETWDLPGSADNDQSGAALYLAIRAVYRERNQRVVDDILRRVTVREMNHLRELGNENFTEIRQVAQNLMCLGQVRHWRSDDVQKELQANQIHLDRWSSFTSLEPEFDFGDIEAIMTTRISLVHSVRQREERDQIGDLRSPFCDALLDLERACLLTLSSRARDASQVQVALNSVVRAEHVGKDRSSDVSREFANVLWLMKEPKLAVQSLSALVASDPSGMAIDDTSAMSRRASLLAQLGTWSSEASIKKPSQIVSECFGPAANITLTFDASPADELFQISASIFHQYAIFAERQYHAISKSPDTIRWKVYIDRKREEIQQRTREMGKLSQNSADYRVLWRQQNQAQAILKQDQERAREHLGQRSSFLGTAVEMYSRCLATSDAFDDDSPIRLCSLWLANFDNDDATPQFDAAMDRIPSRKFVFLAHQLTARLWSSEQAKPTRKQVVLQRVIQRMCREHPYHSLFPLYCIKDTQASEASGSRRQSGRHASQSSQSSSQVERAAAASKLFNKLRSNDAAGERVKAVEQVCDASLEWAKTPMKAYVEKHKKEKKHPIPDVLLIRKLKHLRVPVITAHTPIDPTTRYQNCAWIKEWDSYFTTSGGVNLPKITYCMAEDGTRYKQLYKGEGDDDIRQDAVMEQVFDLVNVVLKRDRETKKRQLSVRGYKIIPLAAQAGVLEFVQDTATLAEWLKSAHHRQTCRYRPQDMKQDQINKLLSCPQRREWRETPEVLIRNFMQVRKHFQPVMRHYFTEKHKTPMAWYAMRLHYARSVATNSIVGHLLGIGDRHTSNILIDNKTGEVVHIDLGIAFEQGKLLPQPERVPFRLTADMIDGLGISGTQGVFQRCAEETLRVLRDGSEIILTVLEVFKYDPLHSWSASEVKIKRAQGSGPDQTAQLTEEALRFAVGIDMGSGAADEAADRVLSTVARKLDKTLSVEYTVNELITEASDPANLALMYIGELP